MEENYPKWIRSFTKIFPFVSSIVIMGTPYKIEIYEWTCDTRYVFFWTNMLTPFIILCLVMICKSSLLVFNTTSKRNEIIMMIFSLIGLPSIICANWGHLAGWLCGPFVPILMPTYYLSIVFFIVFLFVSIYLLRKKNEIRLLLKQTEEQMVSLEKWLGFWIYPIAFFDDFSFFMTLFLSSSWMCFPE